MFRFRSYHNFNEALGCYCRAQRPASDGAFSYFSSSFELSARMLSV